MSWLFILIIYISVILDGIRDKNIDRRSGVNRLLWHIIKWIEMYSLWITLLYLSRLPLELCPLAAFYGYLLWKLGYLINLRSKKSEFF